MTRKHFILLADALRRSKPPASEFGCTDRADQWIADCAAIAHAGAAANPRFNAARFIGHINGATGPITAPIASGTPTLQNEGI